MFKHASVNKAFRLVWSEVHHAWVAVAEFARAHGKRSSGKVAGALLLAAVTAGLSVVSGSALADGLPASALPTGAVVAAGLVNVNNTGTRMDVTQSSAAAIVNWSSFNIGSAA